MEAQPLFYKVAPLSSNEPGPHPALILLHGRGADENDLLDLTSSFDPRLLIVSIRAPYRFPYGGYTWFDLDEQNGINKDQLARGCEALIRCLDELQQNYSLDAQRIFLFGFSMGAMMSLTLSLIHPHRFRGIIAHSGMLPGESTAKYRWDELKGTSFFIAHGTNDPIISVEWGRKTHERLAQVNANVEYHEYPIPHNISEESLRDAIGWLHQKLNNS
jgi:phospholipase/carboxylesterase